jgi:hypothetical protein
MQSIGLIPLIDSKGIIPNSAYQKSKAKKLSSWYTLTHEPLDYLFSVSHCDHCLLPSLLESIVFNVIGFT